MSQFSVAFEMFERKKRFLHIEIKNIILEQFWMPWLDKHGTHRIFQNKVELLEHGLGANSSRADILKRKGSKRESM